eukprot:4029204-Karenia_brevis.AAC.1
MAAAEEKAAKRRLSMSGRSEEHAMVEEKIDIVEYQIEQKAVGKLINAHSQMLNGLEKKEKNQVAST